MNRVEISAKFIKLVDRHGVNAVMLAILDDMPISKIRTLYERIAYLDGNAGADTVKEICLKALTGPTLAIPRPMALQLMDQVAPRMSGDENANVLMQMLMAQHCQNRNGA